MRPVFIPLLERLGRVALRSRGVGARFVDTPLGPVHVYDGRGKGALPTVVLLHGMGASATPFAPLVARLLPHVRRIVAPDYPGHGFSSEPSAAVTPEALFDAMTIALDGLLDEPAIVIGNSLGGALALHYAIKRPDRVAGVVLLSPAGARSTEDEWRAIVASFELHSRAAALSALHMPILLVWGRSERLLPESHFDYYREVLPAHAVLERPERLGHVPQANSPRWVAERIFAFARDVRGPH